MPGIENGKPQLSVYTVKDGTKYFEVIVDQTSGEIANAEPISGGDDLTDAKRQNDGLFCSVRPASFARLSRKQSKITLAISRSLSGRK